MVKAVPDCGYLHTGIEKSCEDKTYSQAITLTDRMDYLNPLGQQPGVLPGGRETAGAGSSQAGAIHSRADGGVAADFVAPGVAGDARDRPGRDVGVLVLLPRARRNPEDFRVCRRAADDDQLHPHRRAGAGAADRLGAARREIPGDDAEPHRRVRKSADRQPHLDGAHQGHRRDFGGRCGGVQHDRADAARGGAGVRQPQDVSVLELRRI